MHRGLFLLPMVFFVAMSAFLVSYDAATAPRSVQAKVWTQPAASSSLPELAPYPELDGVQINVNTADAAQLERLPGIGPSKAQAIADYIAAHGPLHSVEELLEVKGIGEKTLDALRPYIVVE